LRKCLGMYGQFLMLAGFPRDIYPWLLCWPMGSILTYSAAQTVTESEIFAAKLHQLLEDIARQGIKRVSIIGHSMGARALVSYMQHQYQHQDGRQEVTTGALPRIGALVFVNPEADVEAFLAAYPAMKALSDSITVYVDVTDQAIFWSEKVNTLKRWWKAQNCCVPHATADTINTLPNPHEEEEGEVREEESVCCVTYPSLGRLKHGLSISRRQEQQQQQLQQSKLHAGGCQRQSEGSRQVVDDALDIDVDVINAASITDNVDKVRHCHFDLSRETLEDIRELVVDRRRARERRARLIESTSGATYFEFLVAPPYVHH